MDISIEPLKENDLPSVCELYWRACEPEEADHTLPMIYPGGWGPEVAKDIRELLFAPNGGISCDYFVARLETGDIVAVSGWTEGSGPFPADPNDAPPDAAKEKSGENPASVHTVPNYNSKLHRAFNRAAVKLIHWHGRRREVQRLACAGHRSRLSTTKAGDKVAETWAGAHRSGG